MHVDGVSPQLDVVGAGATALCGQVEQGERVLAGAARLEGDAPPLKRAQGAREPRQEVGRASPRVLGCLVKIPAQEVARHVVAERLREPRDVEPVAEALRARLVASLTVEA